MYPHFELHFCQKWVQTGSFDNVLLLLSFSDGREEYDGKTQPADDKSHAIDTNLSVIFENVCSYLHMDFFCGMLVNTNEKTQVRNCVRVEFVSFCLRVSAQESTTFHPSMTD